MVNSNSNCSNPNTIQPTQKIQHHRRNQQWKQRKNNEKKSKIDGDDGGLERTMVEKCIYERAKERTSVCVCFSQ